MTSLVFKYPQKTLPSPFSNLAQVTWGPFGTQTCLKRWSDSPAFPPRENDPRIWKEPRWIIPPWFTLSRVRVTQGTPEGQQYRYSSPSEMSNPNQRLLVTPGARATFVVFAPSKIPLGKPWNSLGTTDGFLAVAEISAFQSGKRRATL